MKEVQVEAKKEKIQQTEEKTLDKNVVENINNETALGQ
jgi:hypothetical protein